jgi:glycosyl transferase, family 25
MSSNRVTIVINLEHRTDRRLDMQRQLESIGWRAEFFPAIRPDSTDDFPSIGVRGCFLSHLSVLKKARDAGAQQLVILEDDVNFSPQFTERWAFSMSELEGREWSIFYPGHKFEHLPDGLQRVPPDTAVQCAHFIMFNGPAIPMVIGGLELILSRPAGHPEGGPMHVDGAYSTIRMQNPSLVTYAYFPALGYQRPSRTDIGSPKWFDRVGALAPAVNLARRLKSIRRNN